MLNCDILPTKSNKHSRLKFLGVAVVLAFALLAFGLGMLGERVLAAPLYKITVGFSSDPADENATDEYAATVSPGDTITYFLGFSESTDPSIGTLWQILPPGMEVLSVDPMTTSQSGDLQTGYVITWAGFDIPDGEDYSYTVTARAPVSASMRTELLSEMFFETDQNTMKSDDVTHWLQPYIGKPNTTSVFEGANGDHEVVAGEMLTVTVFYTIPEGMEIYSMTPRIQFAGGLVPYDSDPAWTDILTDADYDIFDEQKNRDMQHELRYTPTVSFTNGGVLSYTIYARAEQYDIDLKELGNGDWLLVQPILRWCDAPGCVIDNEKDGDYVWWDENDRDTESPDGYVLFLRPEVDPVIVGPTYLDALTQGEGGGAVQFVVQNQNANDAAPAYDVVLTATLGPGLTFDSATPNEAGSFVLGDITYITWTNSTSITTGADWPVTITAKLPDQLVVGTEFTVATQIHKETYAGDQPFEGKYDDLVASIAFRAGLLEDNMTKSASKTDVTVGESVVYTLEFTLSPSSTLLSPRVTDVLGDEEAGQGGIHYVTPTLNLQGSATLISHTLVPGAEGSEILTWYMDDIVTSDAAQTVVATYEVLFDGIGSDGEYTFVGDDPEDYFDTDRADFANVATLYWFPDAASEQSLTHPDDSLVDVLQPYVHFNAGDVTSRTPGPFEINLATPPIAIFDIAFDNDGYSDAYEVRLCQDLPPGVSFRAKEGTGYAPEAACPGGEAADVTWPATGETGTICWSIPRVCARQEGNQLNFQVEFGSDLVAGTYAPEAYVAEYSTLEGEQADERYYSALADYYNTVGYEGDFPDREACGGANCPFVVQSLGMTKVADPATVNPGDTILYTIMYSNTSGTEYTNLVITDTYDALLTLLDAPGATIDAVNRTLMWSPGTVVANATTNESLTFTAQVDPVVTGVYELSNLLEWDASETSLVSMTLVTPIKVAAVEATLSSPVTWTHAAGILTYTVMYTNTGSAPRPYEITFDYDPYLSYGGILYTDGAVRVSDAVFTDTIPANTTRVLEITTTVAHPLPYAKEHVSSSMTVESPGAEAATDELEVLLKRPQFGVFRKTSEESVASLVGSTVHYNIEITNTGDYIATNCVITDTWDKDAMSFVAAGSPNWDLLVAGTASWKSNPFTLTPGSGVQPGRMEFKIEAIEPYYENHVDIVCDQVDQVPTERNVLQSASIQTTKTASDEIAFPDRVLTYTILYTNTNVYAITNAVITDVLPSGFSLIDYTRSDQLSGCQLNDADGTVGDPETHVYWTCDNLLAGATGTLQIWGTVVEPEGGVLTNTTESDGDTPIPFREGDVVVVLPATRPKLALTQTLSSLYVYVAPGDLVTYTVLYQNYGTARADDVQVAIELPDTVTHVSGGTLNGDVVEWSLGSVDAGAEDTLTLVVEAGTMLGEVPFEGLQKISSQRLTWDDSETIYGAEDVIDIKAPSFALVKTADPRVTAAKGDLITYTVVFSNNGGGVLTGIVLEDVFDTQYVTYNDSSASECVETVGADSTEVICDGFGDFIPGQSRTIEFYVTDDILDTVTDQIITNTAVIDSDQTDPLTSNLARVVHNPTCTPVTGVTLAQPSPSAVEIGESATFTATVAPSDAGTPYNYKATYDDGTTQSTQTGTADSNPFSWSSPFDTIGTYTVTVAVWNCWLYESEAFMSNEVALTVTELCYETSDPSFTYSPQAPTTDDTVYFTGTVTGTMPITFYWNFGEGAVVEQSGITSGSTIMIPTTVMHTFTMSKTYTVIMTATNACGVESAYTMDIPVTSVDTGSIIYLPLVLKNNS